MPQVQNFEKSRSFREQGERSRTRRRPQKIALRKIAQMNEFGIIQGFRKRKRHVELSAEIRDALEEIGILPTYKKLLAHIEAHVETFEAIPIFDSAEAYGEYCLSINKIIRTTREIHSACQEALQETGSNQDTDIYMDCSDGRNLPLMFEEAGDYGERHNLVYRPMPGCVIFPEIEVIAHPDNTDEDERKTSLDHIREALYASTEFKEKMFGRLDDLYGVAINVALARHRQEGGKINIKFESHFESEDPHHGCGAHKSDLLASLLETAKDAVITELWLKERYPNDMDLFRIMRTAHDNGGSNTIYTAFHVDNFLSEDEKRPHQDLFRYVHEHFDLAETALEDPSLGIVRTFRSPLLGTPGTHDEQVVHVSPNHFASSKQGKGRLESSWLRDATLVFTHAKLLLLGIAEKNFHQEHPDKPLILHLEIPKDDEEILDCMRRVKAMLIVDPDTGPLLKKKNGIRILFTEIDEKSYEMSILGTS